MKSWGVTVLILALLLFPCSFELHYARKNLILSTMKEKESTGENRHLGGLTKAKGDLSKPRTIAS